MILEVYGPILLWYSVIRQTIGIISSRHKYASYLTINLALIIRACVFDESTILNIVPNWDSSRSWSIISLYVPKAKAVFERFLVYLQLSEG